MACGGNHSSSGVWIVIKLLIDMNLSPAWVQVLVKAGIKAAHRSQVGNHSAREAEISAGAKSHDYVVFTHDLDFGAILAATGARSPSVVQVCTQDVNPRHVGDLIISVLDQFEEQLQRGALVSVDREKSRARILPISD